MNVEGQAIGARSINDVGRGVQDEEGLAEGSFQAFHCLLDGR
jgi:hypothetical protein